MTAEELDRLASDGSLLANLPDDVLSTIRADDPEGILYELVAQEMWPGFIRWARGNAEVCARFTAETGLPLERSAGLAAMIDKVTGFRDHVADRFVEWATCEIFGIEAAPAKYRADIARRRKERGE